MKGRKRMGKMRKGYDNSAYGMAGGDSSSGRPKAPSQPMAGAARKTLSTKMRRGSM